MYPYLNGLPSGVVALLEQAEASRERLRLAQLNRVEDRRMSQQAFDHEERRKGPRRWIEKRALAARVNVEDC